MYSIKKRSPGKDDEKGDKNDACKRANSTYHIL